MHNFKLNKRNKVKNKDIYKYANKIYIAIICNDRGILKWRQHLFCFKEAEKRLM